MAPTAIRPLLAPPYDGVALWWLALPPAPRQRQRQLLQHWLQQQLPRQLGGAIELQFSRGRPAELCRDGTPLGLSLAYAGNAALVGVGPVQLGVDLVWHGDIGDDLLDVAQQFLPQAQQQCLAALPGDLRQPGFGLAWARFEAALKAAGLALAQAEQLPAAAWQRALPVLGLPPGYYAALSVSTPFSD